MKIEINKKNSQLLPYKELSRAIDGATEYDAKVLTLLLSLAQDDIIDTEQCKGEIVSLLDISETEYESSVSYWRGAKVFKLYRQQKSTSEQKEKTPDKKHLIEDRLPGYAESEMSDKIDANPELKKVIDECQQIIGKIFSPADVSVIVGMSDRLGLSGDYITMFAAYCVGMGKKTLRYIEKSACTLYDEGIDTEEKLATYIQKKEENHEKSIIIRKMTGCADRELTEKESKLIKEWLEEYNFGVDIIRKAYEISVDRGLKTRFLPYMGSILKSWYSNGLKTEADVNNMLEQYKKSREENSSGFDTDDFFNKAVAKTKRKQNKTED